jgi:hypothetical protein
MAVLLLVRPNFLGINKKDAKGSLFLHHMFSTNPMCALVLHEYDEGGSPSSAAPIRAVSGAREDCYLSSVRMS